MRLLLTFLVAIPSYSFKAIAEPKVWPPREVHAWVLPYNEIDRMTPEHRDEYLRELRAILVDFEKSYESELTVSWSLPEWIEVEAFLEILPKACADDATPSPSGEDSCRQIFPECKGNPRAAIRKRFYEDKQPCLYGGNVSSYPGQPAKGKCSPVARANVYGSTLKADCASGKTVCNPFVFGVQPNGKAYCAPNGNEVTDYCNQHVPQDSLSKLFGKKSNDNFPQAFDKYTAELEKICGSKSTGVSAQFHCKECRIIYERIFALDTKFRGNLCKQERLIYKEPGSTYQTAPNQESETGQ